MSSINITRPSVAIIIGCWDKHTQPIQTKLYQDILNFVNTLPSIETVIVGNQHNTVANPQWKSTAESIFLLEQPIDWIRRYYSTLPQQQFTRLVESLDHDLWNKKNKIAIQEQWQLEYLLNHYYSHVENVYYFGIGWNVGVQRDYIGWGQLCNSITFKQIRPVNILTHEKLSLVNVSINQNLHYTACAFDYADFSNSTWQPIGNFLRCKQDYSWRYNELEFVSSKYLTL